MFRLRPKPTTGREDEWRCFFCLHVRTGTIILGFWHLMLHVMLLAFLAAIVKDPRLLNQWEEDYNASEMPTPLSNVDRGGAGATPFRDHSLVYQNVDMSALVTICTLAITLMLIYGASRGKPGHLLPFFCLQLFDFAITTLTATGYICYLRSVEQLVRQARNVPWREELLQLPPAVLAMIVLAGFLLAIFVKAYCISVVWRCYKYLTMRLHGGVTILSPSEVEVNVSAQPPHGPPRSDMSSLLPDYDEAIKQTTPPPSYDDLTNMQRVNVPPPQEPPSPPPLYAPPTVEAAPATTVPQPATTVIHQQNQQFSRPETV